MRRRQLSDFSGTFRTGDARLPRARKAAEPRFAKLFSADPSVVLLERIPGCHTHFLLSGICC